MKKLVFLPILALALVFTACQPPYEPRIYTVTVEQPQGGIIYASPTSGEYGTTITLSNTPAADYVFDHYTVNGSEISGNTFALTWNPTVSGVFTYVGNDSGTFGEFQYSGTGPGLFITGYTGSGGTVIIPSLINGLPITGVESSALSNKNLTSVTIPDSVTSIGDGAFAGNPLTRVIIGVNVSLSSSFANGFETAYDNGGKLAGTYTRPNTDSTTWTRQSNGNEINYSDFVFDSATGTITAYIGSGGTIEIPSAIDGVSVTAIGANAFFQKQLTSVTIPDSVTSIGDGAFGLNQLTSITIPNSVISIEYAVFANNQLTSVIIPNSITTIGNQAFAINQLTSVTIGNSVTTIESAAFYQNQLTSITIPDSVTSIEWQAFRTNPLTSITIGANVTLSAIEWNVGSFGTSRFETAYDDSGKLAGTYTRPNTDSTTWTRQSNGNGDGTNYSGFVFDSVTGTFTAYTGAGGAVEIPSSINGVPVTSIGNNAFSYCTSLESITIPDSVTSIGAYAFRGCANLASIAIPDSVTSIGNDAFSGCTSLTSVTIPNSVTSIGASAFRGCGSLTSVTIPDNVTSIGDFAFSGCTSLTSIAIPSSVATVGASSFSGCTSLTDITIRTDKPTFSTSTNWGTIFPASGLNVTFEANIGAYAFYSDSGLTLTKLASVTIGNSVTSIGTYAFYHCPGLTNVTIPSSVTSIGAYAFSSTSLTNVSIPDGVTGIGERAFYHCIGLTNVTIGNSVTSIGDFAFQYCSSLADVTIPDSVTSIGAGAFAYSSLSSVTIPNSVTIGQGAFLQNQLTSVTIGTNVTLGGNGRVFDDLDGNNQIRSSGFEDAYNTGGKLAGTYTRPNTSSTTWTRQ